MATDYEAFYRENPDGLGAPTAEFVRFFDTCDLAGARVLDVGCGQGRDALFIARQGHQVVAVDLSPTGIDDLKKAAHRDKLNIDAIVADIRTYAFCGPFDIIVVDRTLHMLAKAERHAVLTNLLGQCADDAYVLITDERKNLPGLRRVFAESGLNWTSVLEKNGFLFLRRA